VTLRGKISTLEIVSAANGSIHAEELVAGKANVVNQANGHVRVNAKSLSLINAGNGNVTNAANKSER
jgi:hypothetical protein